MKRLIAAGLITAALVVPPAASALATSTGTPGQPNQSCEEQTMRPGNASSAPGSAFNPDGKAGTVYFIEKGRIADQCGVDAARERDLVRRYLGV